MRNAAGWHKDTGGVAVCQAGGKKILSWEKRGNHLAMGLILLAGTMWGCSGIFSREIAAFGIGGPDLAVFRCFGSCGILAVYFLLKDRKLFRIRWRHLPLLIGSGAGSFLLYTICYYYNQQTSPLAVAGILLYTAPAFVAALSAVVFRERITRAKAAALAISFLGCTFVTGIWGGQALSLTPKGLLLGLGSGFFFGAYTIFSQCALAHYHALTVIFYTFLTAGVGAVFLADPAVLSAALGTPEAMVPIAGLTVFITLLAYLLYTKGLDMLGDGSKASILSSVEPVVAAVAGVLLYGETMTLGVALGMVCIVAAVYILR